MKPGTKEAPPPVKRLNRADWLALGVKPYGADPQKWRFKCVYYGNVQSAESVKARNPNIKQCSGWIYFACEGRHTPGAGCDWTLGGLFQIHRQEVVNDLGDIIPTFQFACPDCDGKQAGCPRCKGTGAIEA